MSVFSKRAKLTGAIVAVLALIVCFCFMRYSIAQLDDGNYAIVTRHLSFASLRPGDSVLLDRASGHGRERLVRVLSQRQDTRTGEFYIFIPAHDSIDTWTEGPYSAREICGRVICVIPAQKWLE